MDNDYYGCPNCNGEGTLDDATYCDCDLGRDMETQHRKERTMNSTLKARIDLALSVRPEDTTDPEVAENVYPELEFVIGRLETAPEGTEGYWEREAGELATVLIDLHA